MQLYMRSFHASRDIPWDASRKAYFCAIHNIFPLLIYCWFLQIDLKQYFNKTVFIGAIICK